MGRSSGTGRWVSLVMTAALGLTGLRVAPPARAAYRVEPDATFDELMNLAEQQRDAGDHAKAARSYATAYRGLSDADKPGLLGELAIDNALVAYDEASEQSEDQALLEELETLLGDFVTVRTHAHDAGTAEAVPETLERELERLRATLDQRRAEAAQADQPDEPPPPPVPRPHALDTSIEIFSGGVVALVGGMVLVGVGAWNFAVVNRRAATQLDALEQGMYSPQRQDAFRTELSAWQDQWRRTATGLVIAGSLLTATGIGLTTWGAIRWRRNRRAWDQQRTVGWRPLVVPGGAGVYMNLRLGARRK